MASEERFGYAWDKYAWMGKDYERQFRNWTYPITPDFWKGKRVLDAGCGMGRNSYWPMKYGASSITAFDHDERSVSRARATLKTFPTAEVLFKNIDTIDWKNQYDVAFSIGVIHHLDDPRRALIHMVNALKPGGTLLVWVYSFEGNEWIVRFVDPVRIHITSRLPLPFVHFLSYFCSIPLYLFAKLYRGKNAYLKQLKSFDLWHVHGIVFDQLIPAVAHYWRRDQVLSLVQGMSLTNVEVYPTPEGTGWILRAVKA